MNRRDFLKGILAGAAVAATPTLLNAIPSISLSDLQDGQWHNIEYTSCNGVIKFYVDGEQRVPDTGFVDQYVSFKDGRVHVGRDTISYPMMSDIREDKTLVFSIKEEPSGGCSGFDSLSVWDKKLSDEQLKSLRSSV